MHARPVRCQRPGCGVRLARYRPRTGRLTPARNVRQVYDTEDPRVSALICPVCGSRYVWRESPGRSAHEGDGLAA